MPVGPRLGRMPWTWLLANEVALALGLYALALAACTPWQHAYEAALALATCFGLGHGSVPTATLLGLCCGTP